MIVRILATESDGQVRAGLLRSNGGKLGIESNKSYEGLMQSVSEIRCLDGEDLVTSKEPERWLELLPQNINGSSIRAEIAEDDDDWDEDEESS